MAKNAHSRNRTEDLLIFKVFFDLEKFPTSETQYHYAKRAHWFLLVAIYLYIQYFHRLSHRDPYFTLL